VGRGRVVLASWVGRAFATTRDDLDPVERAAALLWEPLADMPSSSGGGRASSAKGPSKGAQALQRLVADAQVKPLILLHAHAPKDQKTTQATVNI
jgi:hypothetical protein